MNFLQKIIGTIFPPYKYNVLRQENARLIMAVVSSLPEQFTEIKEQIQLMRFLGFYGWKDFPDFKFITFSYSADAEIKYKKRRQDFKIAGLQIFSNLNKRFEDVEILVKDNILLGIKISNSQYQIGEFDFSKINNENVLNSSFEFPPSDIDNFYESLDLEIKSKLNQDDLFDIEFNNRTFYAFYDLEDGNYLAVDKKLKVYSLVHDAKPMATGMKISLRDILNEIANNKFDRDKHLEERYRNSK